MTHRSRALSEHSIAFLLIAVGMATLIIAALRNASWWSMSPGMDGVLTMGLLAFGLMLLQGIGYRRTLARLLPIFGIQAGCVLLTQMGGFALLAVQALLFGVVGLMVGRRAMPSERRAPLGRETSQVPPAEPVA